MVKSVRRRNSRRSRIETRNQRINRLNRSRKKRKRRNSLLNKNNRRISRRKSNRRSKRRTKRRTNKRNNRRSKNIEGGGEKLRTIGRSVARVYNAATPSSTHMREYKSVPNEFKGFHKDTRQGEALEGRFRIYLQSNHTLLTSAAAELGWYEKSGELGILLKGKGRCLLDFLESLSSDHRFKNMLIKLFPRLKQREPDYTQISSWCKQLSDEAFMDLLVERMGITEDQKKCLIIALSEIKENKLNDMMEPFRRGGTDEEVHEGIAQVMGDDLEQIQSDLGTANFNLFKLLQIMKDGPLRLSVSEQGEIFNPQGIQDQRLLGVSEQGDYNLELARNIRRGFHGVRAWEEGLEARLVEYVVNEEKDREREKENSRKLNAGETVKLTDIATVSEINPEHTQLMGPGPQEAYKLSTKDGQKAKMQAVKIFEKAAKSSFSKQYKYMCESRCLSYEYLLKKSSQKFFNPFSKKKIDEILSILLAVNCNLTDENKKSFRVPLAEFGEQVAEFERKNLLREKNGIKPKSRRPVLNIRILADIAKEGFKEPTKHTLTKDEPAVFPIHFSPQGDFARLYILWNAVDGVDGGMRKSSDFVRCILAYIAVNTTEQEFTSFLDHSLPNSPPAIPGFSAMKAIIDVQEGGIMSIRTKGAKPLPNSSTKFPLHILEVLRYSLSVYTVRQRADYFCDIYSNRLADFAVTPTEDEQDIKQVAVQTWEYLWCTSGMVGFLFTALEQGEAITRLKTNLRDMRTGCHAFFKKHSKYCSKAWELFMDESGMKAKGKDIQFRSTRIDDTDGLVYYAKKYQLNSLLQSMGEKMVPDERGYYGIHIDDITRESPNGENYMNVGGAEWEVGVIGIKSKFESVFSEVPHADVFDEKVKLFWKFYYLIESITYDATLIARVAKKEMADAVFNQGDFSLRELIPLSQLDLDEAVLGRGPMYSEVTSDDTYSEEIDKFHTEVLEIESQAIARKIQSELFFSYKQHSLLDTIGAPIQIEISQVYLSKLKDMLEKRGLLEEYDRFNNGLIKMNEKELQMFAKGPGQIDCYGDYRLLNAQICLSLGILLKDIEKQLSREQLTAKLKSVDGFNEILVFDERMIGESEIHQIKKDVVQAAREIDFEGKGMELCKVCLGGRGSLSTVKVLPVEFNRIRNAGVGGIVAMYRNHGLFPFTPGGVDAKVTINYNPKYVPICQSSLKAISLFMKTNQYAEMKTKFSVMMKELGRLLSSCRMYELSGLLSSRSKRMYKDKPVVAQLDSLIEVVLPIEREALFVKGYAQGGTLESGWWEDLRSFLENAYRYESDGGMGQKVMKHEICEFEERIVEALRQNDKIELEKTLNDYQNYILRRLLQSKTNHHDGMAPPLDNYDPRFIYTDDKFAEAILET